MDTTTLDGAIVQVARNCGLVNGQSMTPYSDDGVIALIAAAHEMIRASREWSEMVVQRQRVLDGTTGKITQLITDTKDWKRIRRVYHESMRTPLALVTSYVNPITNAPSNSLIFGYRGMAPEEDNTTGDGRYLIQFQPTTLTGAVVLQIERQIDFTNRALVLPIDWWWHVYMASWMFATDDGTNPGQIAKFESLMASREKQITAQENSRPLWMQPNQLIPNDWWEQDAPYS